jgi:hypothetical protein
MYVNAKMRNVETIPGIEGGRIKENDGGGEYIARTFVNVTWYPQYNNNKKGKKFNKNLSAAIKTLT